MSSNNKPTLTIAIPAYNEEATILRTLGSIKTQNANNYILDEIWIYSDGSTDKTVELVKSNYKDVIVYEFTDNQGKNRRLNQILTNHKTDLIAQIDADIYIKDPNTLDQLVDKMIKDSKIGIACAYHRANRPTTFIGKLSYFGYKIWDRARNNLKDNGIRYYCEGGLRIFTKEFTTVFRLPHDRPMPDDPFSFYFAVTNNFKVIVNKKATIYIDLADNLKDYVGQMSRFLLDGDMMVDYFGKDITKKYELLNFRRKINALAVEFVRNPFIGVCYLLLQGYTKLHRPFYKPRINWVPIARRSHYEK